MYGSDYKDAGTRMSAIVAQIAALYTLNFSNPGFDRKDSNRVELKSEITESSTL